MRDQACTYIILQLQYACARVNNLRIYIAVELMYMTSCRPVELMHKQHVISDQVQILGLERCASSCRVRVLHFLEKSANTLSTSEVAGKWHIRPSKHWRILLFTYTLVREGMLAPIQ